MSADANDRSRVGHDVPIALVGHDLDARSGGDLDAREAEDLFDPRADAELRDARLDAHDPAVRLRRGNRCKSRGRRVVEVQRVVVAERVDAHRRGRDGAGLPSKKRARAHRCAERGDASIGAARVHLHDPRSIEAEHPAPVRAELGRRVVEPRDRAPEVVLERVSRGRCGRADARGLGAIEGVRRDEPEDARPQSVGDSVIRAHLRVAEVDVDPWRHERQQKVVVRASRGQGDRAATAREGQHGERARAKDVDLELGPGSIRGRRRGLERDYACGEAPVLQRIAAGIEVELADQPRRDHRGARREVIQNQHGIAVDEEPCVLEGRPADDEEPEAERRARHARERRDDPGRLSERSWNGRELFGAKGHAGRRAGLGAQAAHRHALVLRCASTNLIWCASDAPAPTVAVLRRARGRRTEGVLWDRRPRVERRAGRGALCALRALRALRIGVGAAPRGGAESKTKSNARAHRSAILFSRREGHGSRCVCRERVDVVARALDDPRGSDPSCLVDLDFEQHRRAGRQVCRGLDGWGAQEPRRAVSARGDRRHERRRDHREGRARRSVRRVLRSTSGPHRRVLGS